MPRSKVTKNQVTEVEKRPPKKTTKTLSGCDINKCLQVSLPDARNPTKKDYVHVLKIV